MLITMFLILIGTIPDTDKATPKDLQSLSKTGKISREYSLVHNALRTMVADAEDGEDCSRLFLHDALEVDLVGRKLQEKGFKVHPWDKNVAQPYRLEVCWN